jgi:hypothetical protein
MAEKLVIFCWMLGHMGLPSNEAPDEAAIANFHVELTFQQALVAGVCEPFLYVFLFHIQEIVVKV